MHDFPREKLQELIVQYGRSLYESPRKTESLLRDLCGEYKREISVLMSAVDEKVPDDLLSKHPGVPWRLLLARLAARLQENRALSDDAATWAVVSWALALDLVTSENVVETLEKTRITQPAKGQQRPIGSVASQEASTVPTAEERTVTYVGGATIDGAPIAYIVVLSAVCTALAFIPFSVIVALGGSFPLSQAIFPLVGWLLGPIAGAVASGVGALVGVFVAPHTAGIPAVRVIGAVVASFVAGSMRHGTRRSWWWLPITVTGVICLALFGGRASVQNGVSLWAVVAGAFIDWSALLLFALPTRTLVSKWISNPDPGLMAIGLGLGTWIAAGMAHLVQGMITYFMYNWPEDVWVTLIPIIPVENLLRVAVGVTIGTGVIAGLRAIGLVKPREAVY